MSYDRQKRELRLRYGNFCMLCERVLRKDKQTYHHRKPKSCGGDASIKNGSILCMQCQKIIHTFDYGTRAYKKLDSIITRNKKKHDKMR